MSSAAPEKRHWSQSWAKPTKPRSLWPSYLSNTSSHLQSLKWLHITFGHSPSLKKKKKKKHLGVILDNTVTMNKHTSKISRTSYLQLRCISSIQLYLTTGAAAKFADPLNIWFLQFSSLWSSLNTWRQIPTNQEQRCPTRTRDKKNLKKERKKKDHVIPLLRCLHRLPVSTRIQDKINSIYYNSFKNATTTTTTTTTTKNYVYFWFSASLHSLKNSPLFEIINTRLAVASQGAFSIIGPSSWSSLPL